MWLIYPLLFSVFEICVSILIRPVRRESNVYITNDAKPFSLEIGYSFDSIAQLLLRYQRLQNTLYVALFDNPLQTQFYMQELSYIKSDKFLSGTKLCGNTSCLYDIVDPFDDSFIPVPTTSTPTGRRKRGISEWFCYSVGSLFGETCQGDNNAVSHALDDVVKLNQDAIRNLLKNQQTEAGRTDQLTAAFKDYIEQHDHIISTLNRRVSQLEVTVNHEQALIYNAMLYFTTSAMLRQILSKKLAEHDSHLLRLATEINSVGLLQTSEIRQPMIGSHMVFEHLLFSNKTLLLVGLTFTPRYNPLTLVRTAPFTMELEGKSFKFEPPPFVVCSQTTTGLGCSSDYTASCIHVLDYELCPSVTIDASLPMVLNVREVDGPATPFLTWDINTLLVCKNYTTQQAGHYITLLPGTLIISPGVGFSHNPTLTAEATFRYLHANGTFVPSPVEAYQSYIKATQQRSITSLNAKVSDLVSTQVLGEAPFGELSFSALVIDSYKHTLQPLPNVSSQAILDRLTLVESHSTNFSITQLRKEFDEKSFLLNSQFQRALKSAQSTNYLWNTFLTITLVGFALFLLLRLVR